MTTLPRWDTTDLFASLSAREFVDALEQVSADTQRAVALFDAAAIASGVSGPVTAERADATDRAITTLNDVLQRTPRTSPPRRSPPASPRSMPRCSR